MHNENNELPKEIEEGNIEYKLKVVINNPERLEELATQLNYRLNEGGGEAFYELGVSDEGELIGLEEEEAKITLANFEEICKRVNASFTIVREAEGKKGKVYELLVRRTIDSPPVTTSIVLIGNADAGKSTIKGVLVHNTLDDGNGLAMSKVARYIHEIKMRRTSSVSTHILGFNMENVTVNSELPSYNESEIYLRSSKIVNLIDLAGHERYLKTTLRGITGNLPDYAMLVVAANSGIVGTFKEHLGISLALRIPVFIVVTKIDIAPKEKLKQTLNDISHVLKLPGINQIPFVIKSKDDAVLAARNMKSGRVVPIFMVSNVNGFGLENLKSFLNLLPPRLRWYEKVTKPFKCYVDELFNVSGVGTVVSGLVEEGAISTGEDVFIGPFIGERKMYRKVKIKSIQINRVFVNRVFAGQSATFAIPEVEYDEVRKGMVLLGTNAKLISITKFKADIKVLHHPTTIKVGYSPVIHLHTIRQTAKIVSMTKDALRTGDSDIVTFQFIQRPEHVEENEVFLFREGRTKGIGVVLETYS